MALTPGAYLQGAARVTLQGVPLTIQFGPDGVAHSTSLAPYADLLEVAFPSLPAPLRGESAETYVARHVQAIGKRVRWQAHGVLNHRCTLPAGEWDGTGSPHVLTVQDHDIDPYGIAYAMDTLNAWSPRLGGSLIAALQDATSIIGVWGPKESLEYYFMWGEEKEWWDDLRFQIWCEIKGDQESEPVPNERRNVRYPVTRAQIRTYIRENHITTPREFRRRAGQATCNAAAHPLSREQLWQVAQNPYATPVQAAALERFLTGVDELRALDARLQARVAPDGYLFLRDMDKYTHCSVFLDTEDDDNSIVAEGLNDYIEHAMNCGDEPELRYATAVELDHDLLGVLADLDRLAALHRDLCGQLSSWPTGHVTPAMRRALAHLKPETVPRRRSLTD